MPTTSIFGWPYPAGTDADNVPFDMQQLAAAIDASLGSAWSSYTSTTTNMPTPTSITSRYKKIGRTVTGHIDVVMSGAPTGIVDLSLPVTMVTPPTNSKPVVGTAFAVDVSTGNYFGGIIHVQGNNLSIRPMFIASLSSSTNDLGWMAASLPFAWASGDTLSLNFSYESAS